MHMVPGLVSQPGKMPKSLVIILERGEGTQDCEDYKQYFDRQIVLFSKYLFPKVSCYARLRIMYNGIYNSV